MRSSKYDVATLAPIVASSRSFSDVMRKLGLTPTGGSHRMITARIRHAGLDTSHFGRATRAAGRAAVSRAILETIVPRCTSVAQVLAELQLPTEGRSHRELSRQIRELALDTSHFRGRGWSRGETKQSHPSVRRTSERNAYADAVVFAENSPLLNGQTLVRRLLTTGRPNACAWCGLTEWRGTKLVLHLDHINGIHNDNRLGNLRFLCPNCHSQTATYCNRSR